MKSQSDGASLITFEATLMLKAITEVKHRLDGRREEFSTRAYHIEPSREAIVCYIAITGWQHHHPEIVVPKGTVSLGYFWADRPLNVYHWLHPSGETIGYYFNVAGETIIRENDIEWWDLTIDFWHSIDGETAFLDEDELPTDLDHKTASHIERVKQELLRDCGALIAEVQRKSAEVFPNLQLG